MRCLINYKSVEKPLPFEDLTVEIGFGSGDFLIKLAKEDPKGRFLGFELSGVAIEKLLRRVRREGLENIFCTRLDAYWGFYLLLKDSSVRKIYMNYPDPWFKKRDIKRRLTKRENLYLFHRKLKEGGTIEIRTDHYPFLEFTLEEASSLGGFSSYLEELDTSQPLTKYEKRWLSMGKKIYRLRLVKRGKTLIIPELRKIKEVKDLFPHKVEKREPDLLALEGREYRLSERVHLKFFSSYEGKGKKLIEALLSEEGFVQKFFVEVRKKGNYWIIDISPHSQVFRTENLRKVLELVAKEGFKP